MNRTSILIQETKVDILKNLTSPVNGTSMMVFIAQSLADEVLNLREQLKAVK